MKKRKNCQNLRTGLRVDLMKKSFAIIAFAFLLVYGCVTPTPDGDSKNQGTPSASPKLTPEQDLQLAREGKEKAMEGRDILKASLRNRGISDFEVFLTPEKAVVEYFQNASIGEGEKSLELAFAAVATAVAYPFVEEVEVHRFVEGRPDKKAVAGTESLLELAAGRKTVKEFQSNSLKITTLEETEALTAKLEKQSMAETENRMKKLAG